MTNLCNKEWQYTERCATIIWRKIRNRPPQNKRNSFHFEFEKKEIIFRLETLEQSTVGIYLYQHWTERFRTHNLAQRYLYVYSLLLLVVIKHFGYFVFKSARNLYSFSLAKVCFLCCWAQQGMPCFVGSRWIKINKLETNILNGFWVWFVENWLKDSSDT